ncbi:hypothetical protein LP7551_01202 [Roseibium album]|nr:hypothetical protein LP7551_01202 [Roseibium album]
MVRSILNAASVAALIFLTISAATTTSHATDKDYVTELIRQVFARTEAPGAAERRPLETLVTSRNRMLLELISGENIEFNALPTKPEWEEKLITIRIPLRKGLQGYRLFFINREDQETLAKVETLEQLKQFPIGSGAQWSTTKALEQAGFIVVTAKGKPELMKMLSLGRFQTYGRGIDEIYSENDKWAAEYPKLAIEQKIALFIPHPTYFFVTPKRPDLAERMERGLREMVADGSFDKLFWEFFEDDIERAGLKNRKVFRIPNPLAGPLTPIDDPALWFEPTVTLADTPEKSDNIR